jgi:hypothetical protein
MQFTFKCSAYRENPDSTAGYQLSLIVVGINQVGRQVPLPARTVVETYSSANGHRDVPVHQGTRGNGRSNCMSPAEVVEPDPWTGTLVESQIPDPCSLIDASAWVGARWLATLRAECREPARSHIAVTAGEPFSPQRKAQLLGISPIEDYAKKRHTPSLRATPLPRGDPINRSGNPL